MDSSSLRFCPVVTSQGLAPVRLYLAVAPLAGASSTDPQPVVLRQGMGYTAYLAAFCDSRGRTVELLELFVQNTGSLLGNVLFKSSILGQGAQEDLWQVLLSNLEDCPEQLRYLGWERENPHAWAFDPQAGLVAPLVFRESGERLLVARRPAPSAAAAGKGQAAAAAPARLSPLVLYVESSPNRHYSVAEVQAGATGQGDFMLEGAAFARPWQPFNLEGGRMIARRLPELSLPEYVKALDHIFNEGGEARDALQPAYGYSRHCSLAYPADTGFTAAMPPALQQAYLLLRLWRDCVRSSISLGRARGRPHLAVSDSSVRVALNPQGGLPWSWSALPVLDPSPGSVELMLPGTGRVFIPFSLEQNAFLRSIQGERIQQAEGSLTLSAVNENPGQALIEVEGSLSRLQTGRKVFPAGSYLLWVRIPQAGVELEFCQIVEHESAVAAFPVKAQISGAGSKHKAWLQSRLGQHIDVDFVLISPMGFDDDLRLLGLLGLALFTNKTMREAEPVADQLRAVSLALPKGAFSPETLRDIIERDAMLSDILSPRVLFPRWTDDGLGESGVWRLIAVMSAFVGADFSRFSSEEEAQALEAHCDLADSLVQAAAAGLFPPLDGDRDLEKILERF